MEIKTTTQIEKRANEINGKLWANFEEKKWVAVEDIEKEINIIITEYDQIISIIPKQIQTRLKILIELIKKVK